MPDPAPNPMPDLFRRLAEIGHPEGHVRARILPDWWDDAAADNPAGYAEALIYVSRGLGLDLASLRDPARRIEWKAIDRVRSGDPS